MTCPTCGKNHYSLCHKCPHQADLLAGKFKDKQFSKTPCSGCKLSDDPSHAGQTFVNIDLVKLDQFPHVKKDAPVELSDDHKHFAMFLAQFIAMSRREQIVATCLFEHHVGVNKWPYRRIAKRLNISIPSVLYIQRRIKKKSPSWGAILAGNTNE